MAKKKRAAKKRAVKKRTKAAPKSVGGRPATRANHRRVDVMIPNELAIEFDQLVANNTRQATRRDALLEAVQMWVKRERRRQAS